MNYDLQTLLRLSVPYDAGANYLAGASVKLLDDEGEPQSFYCALKFVEGGTNIQDTNSWGPLGYMKGEVLEIPTPEAPNDPLAHDPNRFYYAGHLVVEVDEYGFRAQYLCTKTVPVNQNISVTNKEYWTHLDKPKPPINYMVGAAAILFNPEGKVIVGERVDYAGKPIEALFGGKPECDETLAEGLAREVKEEIGLDLDPSRYVEMGIVEASPGRGFKCITGYFAARLTWEEVTRIKNLEPHKCFALHWRDLREVHKNPLWQNPTSYISKAYRFFFV